MKRLKNIPFLGRFLSNEEGGIAVETVLVFPILCWAYLATFVYFDAFRIQSTTAKAAYTVSDQLSRETNYITPSYLDAVYRLHEFLTTSNQDTDLRVSVVRYTDDNGYEVRWSKTRGEVNAMDATTLSSIEDQLPVMPNNEVVLVVENWLAYEPAFNVGLGDFTFENLIVTRPRFNSAQVCWNDSETGNTSSATC